MPNPKPPYPPEIRRRLVELVRSARSPVELSRRFDPTAQAIRDWVQQADLDEGRRADGDRGDLTAGGIAGQAHAMASTKRISANCPPDLPDEAMATTGKGITETLVEGLRLARRVAAYEEAMKLKGKVPLDIDLGESRERAGRRHHGPD